MFRMQFSRVVLSLVAIVPRVFALQAPHPNPTDKATDAIGLENGFTPKPTDSPALPALGYVPHANLFARDQAVFTCGFYDGDSEYPFTCGPTSGCSFATSPYYYFGCCQFTGSVNNNNQWEGTYGDDCYTIAACTEYDDHPYTISGASISGDAVLCGYSDKYCATSYMFDVPGYEGTYTHYDCVDSAYSGDIYDLEWETSTDDSSTYSYTSASGASSTEAPTTASESVHTVVSVSVVRVTVAGGETSTSESSTSTSTSTSSATAESVSSSTTSSSTDGAHGLLPTGLGLAVVAGIAAML